MICGVCGVSRAKVWVYFSEDRMPNKDDLLMDLCHPCAAKTLFSLSNKVRVKKAEAWEPANKGKKSKTAIRLTYSDAK